MEKQSPEGDYPSSVPPAYIETCYIGPETELAKEYQRLLTGSRDISRKKGQKYTSVTSGDDSGLFYQASKKETDLQSARMLFYELIDEPAAKNNVIRKIPHRPVYYREITPGTLVLITAQQKNDKFGKLLPIIQATKNPDATTPKTNSSVNEIARNVTPFLLIDRQNPPDTAYFTTTASSIDNGIVFSTDITDLIVAAGLDKIEQGEMTSHQAYFLETLYPELFLVPYGTSSSEMVNPHRYTELTDENRWVLTHHMSIDESRQKNHHDGCTGCLKEALASYEAFTRIDSLCQIIGSVATKAWKYFEDPQFRKLIHERTAEKLRSLDVTPNEPEAEEELTTAQKIGGFAVLLFMGWLGSEIVEHIGDGLGFGENHGSSDHIEGFDILQPIATESETQIMDLLDLGSASASELVDAATAANMGQDELTMQPIRFGYEGRFPVSGTHDGHRVICTASGQYIDQTTGEYISKWDLD